MQFYQLEYALKVAELKSFSAAAKELYISQPSLSQQITSLEKEIGTLIFYRSSRRVELTEAGKSFMEYARKLLSEKKELDKSMTAFSSLQSGSVNIGMFYTSGYLNLYEDIVDFRSSFGSIDVHVLVDSSAELYRKLIASELDAAILIASSDMLNTKDFIFTRIAENKFAAVIPNNNPLGTKSSIEIKDLYNENIILPPNDSIVRRIFIGSQDDNQHRWHIVGESSPTEACLQMVSAGLGIAITSINTAEKFNTGNYRIVPFVPEIIQPIYIAIRKKLLDVPLMHEFYSFVLQKHDTFISHQQSTEQESPPIPEDCTAVVLAGGRSHRLGKDKYSLKWGNTTLLEHQLSLVSSFKERIVASGRNVIENTWNNDRIRIVDDVFFGIGPIGGLYSGLSEAKYDPVLFLPCDMPFLTDEVIKFMFSQMKPSVKAVIIRDSAGNIHPLCGIYRKAALPYIRECVNQEQYRIRELVKKLHASEINISGIFDDSIFKNINSEKDYQEALLQYSGTKNT